MKPIRPGSKRIFAYSSNQDDNAGLRAHADQTVTVVRPCTPKEADGPAVGEAQMYIIRTDDGWEGSAWEDELIDRHACACGESLPAGTLFVFGGDGHIHAVDRCDRTDYLQLPTYLRPGRR